LFWCNRFQNLGVGVTAEDEHLSGSIGVQYLANDFPNSSKGPRGIHDKNCSWFLFILVLHVAYQVLHQCIRKAPNAKIDEIKDQYYILYASSDRHMPIVKLSLHCSKGYNLVSSWLWSEVKYLLDLYDGDWSEVPISAAHIYKALV